MVVKSRIVGTFGLVLRFRDSKVSIIARIGRVVVAKPRIIVTFPFVSGERREERRKEKREERREEIGERREERGERRERRERRREEREERREERGEKRWERR